MSSIAVKIRPTIARVMRNWDDPGWVFPVLYPAWFLAALCLVALFERRPILSLALGIAVSVIGFVADAMSNVAFGKYCLPWVCGYDLLSSRPEKPSRVIVTLDGIDITGGRDLESRVLSTFVAKSKRDEPLVLKMVNCFPSLEYEHVIYMGNVYLSEASNESDYEVALRGYVRDGSDGLPIFPVVAKRKADEEQKGFSRAAWCPVDRANYSHSFNSIRDIEKRRAARVARWAADGYQTASGPLVPESDGIRRTYGSL